MTIAKTPGNPQVDALRNRIALGGGGSTPGATGATGASGPAGAPGATGPAGATGPSGSLLIPQDVPPGSGSFQINVGHIAIIPITTDPSAYTFHAPAAAGVVDGDLFGVNALFNFPSVPTDSGSVVLQSDAAGGIQDPITGSPIVFPASVRFNTEPMTAIWMWSAQGASWNLLTTATPYGMSILSAIGGEGGIPAFVRSVMLGDPAGTAAVEITAPIVYDTNPNPGNVGNPGETFTVRAQGVSLNSTHVVAVIVNAIDQTPIENPFALGTFLPYDPVDPIADGNAVVLNTLGQTVTWYYDPSQPAWKVLSSVDVSTLSGQAFGPVAATLLQRTAVAGPDIYVDPLNSTGLASDANNGLTATTPILTTNHLNLAFLFFRFGTVTVHYLSDDHSGVSPDWSEYTGSILFIGTAQTLHTGGTLDAGTIALNSATAGGGQRQTAHTSDLGAFAPFLPDAVSAKWIRDTVTGGQSWIVSGAGATASVSQPTSAVGVDQGALTIGDAYVIERGSILSVSCESNTFAAFQGFALSQCVGNFIGLQQCSISVRNAFATISTSCIDCYINTIDGVVFMNAGVYINGNFDFSPFLQMMNNTYVTGLQLILGQANIQSVQIVGSGNFVPGTYGAGAQFQDMLGAAAIHIQRQENFTLLGTLGGADPLLWGNGNAHLGMLIAANAVVPKTVPPTVTGTDGDFGFSEATGTVQVARAWVEATASWTDPGAPPSRATTWANWAAAIGGGGFGFAAQDVSANIALIGE